MTERETEDAVVLGWIDVVGYECVSWCGAEDGGAVLDAGRVVVGACDEEEGGGSEAVWVPGMVVFAIEDGIVAEAGIGEADVELCTDLDVRGAFSIGGTGMCLECGVSVG